MHRFFLAGGPGAGGVLVLGDAESQHAARVLRVQPGDPIEVLDGRGGIRECRVLEVERRRVTAEVRTLRAQARPPSVELAASILKGRAMDLLVQKATELGAAAIHPILSERCVVQVAAGERAAKVAGWLVTAMEAAKQCGNAWLPALHEPVPLPAFLASRSGGLLLAGVLDPAARSLGETLAGLDPGGMPVTLLLGPEGDFSPAEQEAIRTAGGHPISLGPLVLRAETAAIAGLAILQHELGRHRPPQRGV